MPDYYCSECEEEFFDRSMVVAPGPCQLCGADETVSLAEDEHPPEPPTRQLDPRAEARAAAETLLAEQGVSAPPVDVVAIAEALGLQVSYSALGDVDGELRGDRIRINRDHHPVRQRFTIAHELGHLRLHTSHGAGAVVERQAEVFAGALLVPPGLLRAAVVEQSDFEALRHRFEVSRPALTIALREANLTGRVSNS
ncbi:MAG: ImmA/IrrE family metallo-endopeptidase [Solirubrobacterales bacterium]